MDYSGAGGPAGLWSRPGGGQLTAPGGQHRDAPQPCTTARPSGSGRGNPGCTTGPAKPSPDLPAASPGSVRNPPSLSTELGRPNPGQLRPSRAPYRAPNCQSARAGTRVLLPVAQIATDAAGKRRSRPGDRHHRHTPRRVCRRRARRVRHARRWRQRSTPGDLGGQRGFPLAQNRPISAPRSALGTVAGDQGNRAVRVRPGRPGHLRRGQRTAAEQ
jgi:hypothetical protein